jgi:hypothetical protein
MKKLILIIVIVILSCDDTNRRDFSLTIEKVLKLDEIEKFNCFDSTSIEYFPNYNIFKTFRDTKNNEHVDILDRTIFFTFLKNTQHLYIEPFSKLVLIEKYSSGESINNNKILIINCKKSVKGFIYKKLKGEWVLNKEYSLGEEKFENFEKKEKFGQSSDFIMLDNFFIISEIQEKEKIKSFITTKKIFLENYKDLLPIF